MPSSHLILCHLLLLLPSIFPSIRVFSNDSVLRIRWPKYWSFSFSISPSKEYSGLISFRIDWFDLVVQESSPTPQFRSINSLALSFLSSPTLTSIRDCWRSHSFDQMDLCWRHLIVMGYIAYVEINQKEKAGIDILLQKSFLQFAIYHTTPLFENWLIVICSENHSAWQFLLSGILIHGPS